MELTKVHGLIPRKRKRTQEDSSIFVIGKDRRSKDRKKVFDFRAKAILWVLHFSGREQVCIFCPWYFSYYFHNEFRPFVFRLRCVSGLVLRVRLLFLFYLFLCFYRIYSCFEDYEKKFLTQSYIKREKFVRFRNHNYTKIINYSNELFINSVYYETSTHNFSLYKIEIRITH